MNLQTLLAQMGNASNPMAMLTSLLTPNQKQTISQFQNKPNDEQAQEIAKICNEKNITKEQLQQIITMFNKR